MASSKDWHRGGRPRRRGITAAQQAAHDKAYAACDHTIEGRYAKGDVVADGDRTWKVVTHGIRYHDDISSRLHGVQPCRGPAGWRETCELRAAIARVLAAGIHEPGSRAGPPACQQDRPPGAVTATWQDGRPGSLASYPRLTVYEGGVVGAVRPIYDDAPVVAWVHDSRLAARLRKLIAACPRPILLPQATVRERRARVEVAATDPRHVAYAAARDARPHEGGVDLPSAEYRRIKAEQDAGSRSACESMDDDD